MKRDLRLPLVRRDYSAEDMDAMALATVMNFNDRCIVWHGREPIPIKDYILYRRERNRVETRR